MIGIFWDICTPIFYLNIQTNKLFKKNLKILNEARNRFKEHLEEKNNDSKSLSFEAVKAMEKEIKDFKKERDSFLKLIIKYQDENKNYRDVLKIWRDYLLNLEEYNNADKDPYLSIYEIMSDAKIIDLENKLTATKKTLKEVSERISI